VIDLWFSLGLPVSSTNKTDCHDITEILLKVALSTIQVLPDTTAAHQQGLHPIPVLLNMIIVQQKALLGRKCLKGAGGNFIRKKSN
jgi:hypothetical protein